MEYYRIGEMNIAYSQKDIELKEDGYMERFRVPASECVEGQDVVFYENSYLDLAQYRNEKLIQKNSVYELYDVKGRKLMIYHWARCRFAFGYWLDELEEGSHVRCFFHPDIQKDIPLTTSRFFSCAGLHGKLLQRGAAVLHASYIDWNGQAILFAAASGTGKSTQAALWERYAGAEILNGDRVLLREREQIWNAYGYPCCGSSDICVNRNLPLRAIVILEQGSENQVSEIPAGEKIRTLLAGIEVYRWSIREIDKALELAEQIARKVPVVKFVCRPEEGAVTVLKNYLEECV